MKRSLLLVLTLLISLSTSLSGVEDPELRKILNEHVKAMGGWRAWNSVESVRLTGTIERNGETVDFCIIKKRPNKIRATITMPIPGNDDEYIQLIRAHNGKKGWTATRLAGSQELLNQQRLEGAAAAQLLDEATVMPKLISMWQNGADLTIGERTEFKGHNVLSILANDNTSRMQTTFLLCENTYTVLSLTHEEPDGALTTTEQSDYLTYSEVMIPRQILINAEGTGRTVMRINSVEVGVGIYEAYFSQQTTPLQLNIVHQEHTGEDITLTEHY